MGRDGGCDGGAGSSSSRGGQGFEGRHLGGWESSLSGIRSGGRVEARRREGVGGRESSQAQAMERWNLTDQEGARRRARRVLLRDQSPIQPAPVSRKKGEMRKRNPIPQKSRLVVLRCDVRQKNQQQQDSGMELERGRGADNGWRRMEWGESGTCDSGAGSLFCHPPRAGGVGAQRRPREERSCSPTDTTHRAPTSVRTLSSPHPTRPHTSSAGATFGTPLFFSFCHFQPAGEHGNRCFPCERGFFLAPGNQSWRDMDFQMPMSSLRRHLPPEETGGGGGFHGGKGGRRLVEVPLPTTHRSGASSRPPLPPGRIPPPPPSIF